MVGEEALNRRGRALGAASAASLIPESRKYSERRSRGTVRRGSKILEVPKLTCSENQGREY